MKHLEPRQIDGQPAREAAKAGKSGWRWIVLVIAATIGLGALGTALMSPDTTDRVSSSQVTARQAAFDQARPLELARVSPAQTEQTLDQMKLQTADRAALKAQLAAAPSNRPLRLVSLTLWDTHAEDGDVVAVQSAGYSREIVLTKAPQTIAFPVDAAADVRLIGVRDGGGGITLGVRGPNQELLMPIMSEGQTIVLPVAR
jgi:hypothetical protein